jgi:heme-degrading monooxygenase HmoA
MILVLFEFIVNDNRDADYFIEVEKLQLELRNTEGFISVDRFKHYKINNYYASISTWKNEIAIKKWKNNSQHLKAQKIGKKYIFKSFRIRIANVYRDYDFN